MTTLPAAVRVQPPGTLRKLIRKKEGRPQSTVKKDDNDNDNNNNNNDNDSKINQKVFQHLLANDLAQLVHIFKENVVVRHSPTPAGGGR